MKHAYAKNLMRNIFLRSIARLIRVTVLWIDNGLLDLANKTSIKATLWYLFVVHDGTRGNGWCKRHGKDSAKMLESERTHDIGKSAML